MAAGAEVVVAPGFAAGGHSVGVGFLCAGKSIGSRRREKSNAPARFLAPLSRSVIGSRPQRHSIIFSTEQCSYGPAFSTFFGANGLIAIAAP